MKFWRVQAGDRDSGLGVYPGHRAEPLRWLGWPVVRRSDEAAVAHGALPNNGGAAVVLGLVAALAGRGRVQEGARGQLKAEAGSGRACLGLEWGSRQRAWRAEEADRAQWPRAISAPVMELLEGRGNTGAGQWASARARGGAGPQDSEGVRRERSRGGWRG